MPNGLQGQGTTGAKAFDIQGGFVPLAGGQGGPVPADLSDTVSFGADAEFVKRVDATIPDIPTVLQHVDGQIEGFYNGWAELKTYAHTMKEQTGIDVTRPDLSDPQAMKANQLFMKALAVQQAKGLELQNAREDLKQAQGHFASGNARLAQGVDVGDRPFDFTKDVLSQQIDPLVTSFMNQYAGPHQTESARNSAQKELDGVGGVIKDKIKNSKAANEIEYWVRQLDALGKAIKDPKVFQVPSFDKKLGVDISSAMTGMIPLMRLFDRGAGAYTRNADTGELENTEFQGQKFGKFVKGSGKDAKIIEGTIKRITPTSKGGIIVWPNESLTPVEYERDEIQQAFTNMATANKDSSMPRADKRSLVFSQKGMLDETGSVNPVEFMRQALPNTDGFAEARSASENLDQRENKLGERMDQTGGLGGRTTFWTTDRDGNVSKVTSSYFGGEVTAVAGDETKTGTPDQVRGWLADKGFGVTITATEPTGGSITSGLKLDMSRVLSQK